MPVRERTSEIPVGGETEVPRHTLGRILEPRYLAAAVALVLLVVVATGLLGAWQQRRTLQATIHSEGLVLLDLMVTSAHRNLEANRLLEESIAQRLLDNAHLIDRLFEKGPVNRERLAALVELNGLNRVEFLDEQGRLLEEVEPPAHGSMGMMGRMMRERMGQGPMEGGREAMAQHHLRHRRSLIDPILRGKAREAMVGFGEERFWLGSEYGVAVKREAAPGIVLITAPAEYILTFRKEIGLQRLIDDLARNPLITDAALVGPDLAVVVDSRPDRIGATLGEPFYRRALAAEGPTSRLVEAKDVRVLELARPLRLGQNLLGLFRLGVSLEASDRVWFQAVRTVGVYSLAVALVGVAGMGAIFLTQQRQRARLRALEREVDQRERLSALGNLAAGVAHEIRNPLNAIAIGLQRLDKEFAPASQVESKEFGQITKTIQGEVGRLNRIVEEFLSLARPPGLSLKICRPADLLEELDRILAPEAHRRGLLWSVSGEGLTHEVRWDPERLKQALWNVVLNALEATPEGGTVRVEADTVSGEEAVVISVIDTGTGIPPEVRERVFEPYYTTKEGGTGLGLALARQLVEVHGGRITLSSEAGKGTTVRLVLPRITAGST